MSSSSRAWIAAASIGAVEALKDQGFCRWNYGLRSIQQHVKNNIRSCNNNSQPKKPSAVAAALGKKVREDHDVEKLRKSEESLRTVMYLSCWGPNN